MSTKAEKPRERGKDKGKKRAESKSDNSMYSSSDSSSSSTNIQGKLSRLIGVTEKTISEFVATQPDSWNESESGTSESLEFLREDFWAEHLKDGTKLYYGLNSGGKIIATVFCSQGDPRSFFTLPGSRALCGSKTPVLFGLRVWIDNEDDDGRITKEQTIETEKRIAFEMLEAWGQSQSFAVDIRDSGKEVLSQVLRDLRSKRNKESKFGRIKCHDLGGSSQLWKIPRTPVVHISDFVPPNPQTH